MTPAESDAPPADGEELLRRLSGAKVVRTHDRVTLVAVPPHRLQATLAQLMALPGARLADLFAVEQQAAPAASPGASGGSPAPGPEADSEVTTPVGLRVVVALDRWNRYVVLASPVQAQEYPQLSQLAPAAFVEECELYEQWGIRPRGGTPLNRILLPPTAAGERPLRGGSWGMGRPADLHAPHVVVGEAFEFPVGPVRGVAQESLYLGLVTTGEELLDSFLLLWHKHRGIERRLTGLTPDRALFQVERLDGLTAVGNGLAFCRAVERAAGWTVSLAASRARQVALELERCFNHAAAVAAVCQATGLGVGQAQAEQVLERLLRLNAAVVGHRYLFNVLAPGGVRRWPDLGRLGAELGAVLDGFRDVTRALLRTNSHLDRLEAAGIVSAEAAARLGLVGPVARACGRDVDARRDHPEPGALVPAAIPLRHRGDVLSRIEVMREEVEQSACLLQILCQAGIERDAQAATAAPLPRGASVPADELALGWAESARGEALAAVALDPSGRIAWARLRPAPVRNWRAFDDALRSRNVFTDVAIIEASFWQTVAGFAR
ncbi:MAG TPA: NADH-quinone oxidoreductase subunit C [Verrucomicrobiae bacterium]|nr:NADH-quinone oxidoreductase subunit C [Verrucomicrobiae bacterium]